MQTFRMKTTSLCQNYIYGYIFLTTTIYFVLYNSPHHDHVTCIFILRVYWVFIKDVSRQWELAEVNVDKNVLRTWMLFPPVLRHCNKRRCLNHRVG